MTQGLQASFLSRIGSEVFGFLSRCEESRILPKTSRWLKFVFAGLCLTLLTACVKKPPLDQMQVTCYEPVAVYPVVSEIMIKPDPTNGADSVTVTAKAHMVNEYELDAIASAQCIVEDDTFQMHAQDGAFDDRDEEVVGRIYVGGIKKDSVEIKVKVDSKNDGWNVSSAILHITK